MRVKWINFDLEMYIGTSALWDQEMQYILGLESESLKIYCLLTVIRTNEWKPVLLDQD